MKKKKSASKGVREKSLSDGEKISKNNLVLDSNSFVKIHWDIAHAILNNKLDAKSANAVAEQTSRIIGFKKLELERAKMIGERPTSKLLGSKG